MLFFISLASRCFLYCPSQDLEALERKLAICTEAEKQVRHALSSVQFQDVNATVQKLQAAIQILAVHATP
jgi:hypothetical protein